MLNRRHVWFGRPPSGATILRQSVLAAKAPVSQDKQDPAEKGGEMEMTKAQAAEPTKKRLRETEAMSSVLMASGLDLFDMEVEIYSDTSEMA